MSEETQESCRFDGCERDRLARGLCRAHYRQDLRGSGLTAIRSASAEERFWTHVEKTSTCWLWTGTLAKNGYGRVKVDGRMRAAHRVAYEWLVGPIPEGLELDHVKARGCTSRACVNPAHLEPVSHRENTMRGDTITAHAASVTHCPRGHELSESNLVPSSLKNGRRDCLTCSRDRARKRREQSS